MTRRRTKLLPEDLVGELPWPTVDLGWEETIIPEPAPAELPDTWLVPVRPPKIAPRPADEYW